MKSRNQYHEIKDEKFITLTPNAITITGSNKTINTRILLLNKQETNRNEKMKRMKKQQKNMNLITKTIEKPKLEKKIKLKKKKNKEKKAPTIHNNRSGSIIPINEPNKSVEMNEGKKERKKKNGN